MIDIVVRVSIPVTITLISGVCNVYNVDISVDVFVRYIINNFIMAYATVIWGYQVSARKYGRVIHTLYLYIIFDQCRVDIIDQVE